jgi:hypothetical protein
MRRWVCVIALLFGFAGDGYAWTIGPRVPVAIERPYEPASRRDGMAPTGVWWQAS